MNGEETPCSNGDDKHSAAVEPVELTPLRSSQSDADLSEKQREADGESGAGSADAADGGGIIRLSYEEAVHRYHGRYQIVIFSEYIYSSYYHPRTSYAYTHTTAKANAAHKHYCNFFTTTATVFSTVFIAVSINMISKFSGER